MNKDDIKNRLISHGSTPEERASVALQRYREFNADGVARRWQEHIDIFTERFQSAEDETLAAVSHILDEVLSKLENEGDVIDHKLRDLAKALRGEVVEHPEEG